MRSNVSKNTKPELALRALLYARGHRYRVDFAPIPALRRHADIVFTRLKLAVFVNGCFWHCCPQHATFPKSNADYWLPKLARNVERDKETDVLLTSQGWTVLRVWEHTDPDVAADEVIAVLERKRAALEGER